jgi:hypothetical protein
MNAVQTLIWVMAKGSSDMPKDQTATQASDLLGELQESDERDVTLLSELGLVPPSKAYVY